MILVFDLDDTLYNEISFVESGLFQVSKYVNTDHKINQKAAYEFMLEELDKNGRGKIFDTLLKNFGVYSKASVRKCLTVYRLHTPEIKLNPDADRCLDRFKNNPKYIVTDGNKIVQTKKIQALQLNKRVKKVFITHYYGLQNVKPSPFCFNKIMELEKTVPENVLYVGDNPNKDFINIKKLGFKTIRLIQGMFADLKLDNEYEAHINISSLDQLTDNLIDQLHG